MKYPFILFYRDNEYEYIDSIIERNSNDLQFTMHVIHSKKQLNNFYKQTYPILIIFEKNNEKYQDIVSTFDSSFSNRMIHFTEFTNNWVAELNKVVNEMFKSSQAESKVLVSNYNQLLSSLFLSENNVSNFS